MPALTVHVSANVYSGRENPSWDLRAPEASEFASRVAALAPGIPVPRPEELGYRGLEVTVRSGAMTYRYVIGAGSVLVEQQTGAQPDARHSLEDRGQQLELWLIHTGEQSLGPDLVKYLSDSVAPRRQP